jgi:signal peptidase I
MLYTGMMDKNQVKKIKKGLRKVWWFIWEDNSVWSWIVNIILAFVIIKFLVYPALGFALGTTHPVVAVVSSSMEHNSVPICLEYSNGRCELYKIGKYAVCGFEVNERKFLDLDEYYKICGGWYSENTNITKEMFRDFKFKNGFNKGDIMVLARPKNVEIGDIIVFYVEHRPDPIIHRVIEITEKGYTTKGDHNHDSADFENDIEKDKVIGRAVMRVPLLGWIKIGFMGLLRLFAGG